MAQSSTLDQSSSTPMKRRLSLLATQCWQNVTKQEAVNEAEKKSSFPPMPKLDNATPSPRSSICAPGDVDDANHAINQLDQSLFEPIALVTPPKKRVKSESAAIAASLSNTFDYRPEFNRMTSLQYPTNNFSSYNAYGQYPATSMYHQQAMYGKGTSDLLAHYAVNSTLPKHGFTFSATAAAGSNFETGPATSTAAVTPVTTNKRPSISLGGGGTNTYTNVLLEDFEPLFADPSENDSTDRCPDLCASSASMSSSSSSLLDDGNIIISTSDSFKENNYAKAEVEVMSNFTPDLSLQSVIGQLNEQKKYEVSLPAESTTTSSKSSKSKSKPSSSKDKDASTRFKPFHEEKWSFHYKELLQFKKETGHCLVPHTFPAKPHLARWVKRQRRQYKLRLEGNKNSTMTPERIDILNEIGFVWDSHEVIWNERFSQLVSFKQKVGHCRVPSYCKDCPQLASWVKCQRRQYKLFWEEGKGSSMTMDRIKLLNSIGFIWEVHPGRKKKENDQHLQHLANILMDA